jgi:hypothetical protein
MPLDNPHREYDKGMEDAYWGNNPNGTSANYHEGYQKALQLFEEEDRRRRKRDETKQYYLQSNRYPERYRGRDEA